MEITSNELSLILQQNLATSTQDIKTNLAQIAAGEQTKAVEGAAELLLAEGMESERRGSQQAIENAQIGMSMLDTAESGLSSVTDNLQRIRELTVQRGNGTLNNEAVAAIDDEISALTSEIDRVSESTSFNDVNLLDGSSTDVSLQIGADSGETVNVGESLSSISSESLGLNSGSLTLDDIDNALSTVTSQRSKIGAAGNGLESTINGLYTTVENLAASESTLIDTDIASAASELAKNGVLQNASGSLLAQANQSPAIAATLL